VLSLALLFWEIMRIESGQRATVLLRCFVGIPFVFLLVLQLKNVALFDKAIAKMPFVKAFFHLKSLPLSAPLLATLTRTLRNIGFSFVLFMTGLQQSPHHWYDKINAILCSISLTSSLEDPCLYSGFIQDPNNPSGEQSASPLLLGLYVDDFVYFSEDPAVKN
jgi:hypothetical protein